MPSVQTHESPHEADFVYLVAGAGFEPAAGLVIGRLPGRETPRSKRPGPTECPKQKVDRDSDFVNVTNVLGVTPGIKFHDHFIAGRTAKIEKKVQVEGLLVA
jgi:hypothetical protein